MNTNPAPTLNIQEIPKLAAKYKFSILIAMVAGTLLGGMAAQVLPKKFKSHFVLTVYSNIFKAHSSAILFRAFPNPAK